MYLALQALRRDPEPVLARAEQLVALLTEQQVPILEGSAYMFRGWALARQGRHEEGIAQLRRGLELRARIEARMQHGLFMVLLADAYAASGASRAACAVVDEALEATPEEIVMRPDLLRLRGELLAREGADAAAVEASYREAIALAREMSARWKPDASRGRR